MADASTLRSTSGSNIQPKTNLAQNCELNQGATANTSEQARSQHQTQKSPQMSGIAPAGFLFKVGYASSLSWLSTRNGVLFNRFHAGSLAHAELRSKKGESRKTRPAFEDPLIRQSVGSDYVISSSVGWLARRARISARRRSRRRISLGFS